MGIISAELQLALAQDLVRQCKADDEAAEALQRLGVTAYGVEYDEDGGWRAWWLFTRGAPFAPSVGSIHWANVELGRHGSAEDYCKALDIINAFLAPLPLAYEGSGGPGQPFAGRPYIRSTPNHVLVRQSGGLDI
jgi:hypothetical protein